MPVINRSSHFKLSISGLKRLYLFNLFLILVFSFMKHWVFHFFSVCSPNCMWRTVFRILHCFLSSISSTLSPAAVTSYVKSFETASMKLGADMRMVMVQMIEKSEKATRHSRSTTAAANFHSLQMASASSWSRNRWAMYDTSCKIHWISGGGMLTPIPLPPMPTLPTPPGGSVSSLGEPWTRPPSATPESLEGGQYEPSTGW